MIRKFLAPKLNSKEDRLRTNIFYTTCNIKERVCNMILFL